MKKGYLDEHGVMQFPTSADALFGAIKFKFNARRLSVISRQTRKSMALADANRIYQKGFCSWDTYWELTERIYQEL